MEIIEEKLMEFKRTRYIKLAVDICDFLIGELESDD